MGFDVLGGITDAVAALDRNWRYTYVNRQAEIMARMPRQQLAGKVIWELFPELRHSAAFEFLHRTMRDGVRTRFEQFYAPYNLWVEVDAYPAADGLVMFVHAIGDRDDSTERYRALFESMRDGVIIVNDDGRYVDVNQSFCGMLKAGRERLIGSHFGEFIPPEKLNEAISAFADLRSGRSTPVDFPLRALDGSIVEVAWTSSNYLPGLYFCIGRDITARKQAEHERGLLLAREREARRNAELLNSVGPLLAGQLDAQKLVQSVTDIATRLVDAGFGAFFHNVVNEKGESYMLYALSGVPREAFDRFPMPRNTAVFGPTFRGEGILRSDDITQDPRYGNSAPHYGLPPGHPPVKSYLAAPVVSVSGEVLGGLFFGHPDRGRFTENHEAIVLGIAAQAAIALDNARLFEQAQWVQKELKRSNQELRRANQDLETFAYSASHDLQEPLRNIAIAAQLLGRHASGLDPAAQPFLDGVLSGALRMQNLIRDLLAYTQAARYAEGPVPRTDSGAVLASVLENLRARIAETGATVTTSELPSVSMQLVHLTQLFQNLIGNALKYRGKEAPAIRVSAVERDGWWVFSVADNGIGIEPRYKDYVFQLFKRLHTREQYSGSGVGLPICQRIVEQYGGRIWLESSVPGEGSIFAFSIPVHPSQ